MSSVSSSDEPPSPPANPNIGCRKWDDYFDEHFYEEIDQYFSVYSKNLEIDRADQSVLFCIHGAGYSALTFALFAKYLLHLAHNDLAIVAIDMRAHGHSQGMAGEMSLERLVADSAEVIERIKRRWTAPHYLFLLGHSLGGSVATRIAKQNLLRSTTINGLIVIDIVEEVAIRALASTPSVLAGRPQQFSSPEEAIRWSLRHKHCLNVEAASISIPDQLCSPTEYSDDGCPRQWRVNLMDSQGHWADWFRGMSADFVSAPTPKLLVLAEREYLDKTLMIASMQGKFQCSIVRNSGHAIQEDAPEELAEIVSTFIERNLLVAKLNERSPYPINR